MDPELHRAACQGDITQLKPAHNPDVDQQATKMKSNTALHIALFHGQDKFAKELCNKYPALLTRPNKDGDTPLHLVARDARFLVARDGSGDLARFLMARDGSGDLARFLISKITQHVECAAAAGKLRMRNKDNLTPLHEAVRNNNIEVAKLLMAADSCWAAHDNDADNSLLYLAADSGSVDMVKLILEKASTYDGSKGEKALYKAAANHDFAIVDEISEKNIQIIQKADENGKTPLHHAAEYGDDRTIIKKLIERYPYSAFHLDKDGHSPLHIAVQGFHSNVVRQLIKHCPDCLEQLSKDEETVLHFAVKSEKLRMVVYIVEKLGLTRLLNQPDVHGNTPFHVSASLSCSRIFFYFAFDARVEREAINNEKLTAFDIQDKQPRNSIFSAMSNMWVKFIGPASWRKWIKKLDREEENQATIDKYKEMVNTLGTVATLITTVTFASALQVPGGFSSGGDNSSASGMATLAGDPFFEDFMIADTIAMGLSLTAMFLILFSTYFNNKKFIIFMEAARILTFLSFLSTGMAFMEGVAAVLPGGDLKNLITRGFGIAVWCPYIFAIVGFLIFFYPLVVPTAIFVFQSTPQSLRKRIWFSRFASIICFLYH